MALGKDWIESISSGKLSKVFSDLYPNSSDQASRYSELLRIYADRFGFSGEVRLFSTPGRTELAGNHTDHNHGRVIAGSVHLDAVAAVGPATEEGLVRVFSTDLDQEFIVSLHTLEVNPEEMGSTEALIRGVAAWFVQKDKRIGGFSMVLQSNVLRGSGLSSSACVEVLFATVFDRVYNGGTVSPVQRAICGQFAENVYFGKPSGLMDQTACSVGGVVGIDFKNPQDPQVSKVEVDFGASGYRLAIINTKSDHTGGADDYGAMPREMKLVAQALGAQVLAEVEPSRFWGDFLPLKTQLPGRAMARAGHFFLENARVPRMLACLTARPPDFASWLRMVAESGNSSYKYLQNAIDEVENQDYALAIMLAEAYEGCSGQQVVARVHGGGLGGTIQVYVPQGDWTEFVRHMETGLGEGCVIPLRIRNYGSIEIEEIL